MRGGIVRIFMTYQGTQDVAFSNFSLTLKESDAQQKKSQLVLANNDGMHSVQRFPVKRHFNSLKELRRTICIQEGSDLKP